MAPSFLSLSVFLLTVFIAMPKYGNSDVDKCFVILADGATGWETKGCETSLYVLKKHEFSTK